MDETYDPFLNRARWQLKFAWIPKRCYLSNRWIWLMLGYKGVAMWTGPGTPVFETNWITKEEFVVGMLKGTLC